MTDPGRIEELCDLILENGLDRHLLFIAETRVEDVVRGREILGKMRRAGFARIGCGVESPNKETHRFLHKGLNLNHVEQAAELLTGVDIMFSKFLIIGHENEDEADILNYPDYALSLGVKRQNTTFFVMTPYPGTDLETRYREQGLVTSLDWDLYTNFGAVIAPKGMTSQRLQTLLCAVTARYGLYRRFNAGSSLSSGPTKLFEILFIHTKLMLLSRRYSVEEVEQSLWDVLTAIQGSAGERPCPDASKGRTKRDLAVYFHARDREPVVVRSKSRGGVRRLTIGKAEEGPKPRAFHVSLGGVVRLTERVDYRSLVHDLMTLRTHPRGFKMTWLPSFGVNVARVVSGLVGLGTFHLARRWGRVGR